MEKIFAEMFSRRPDEITEGDYYYRVGWYEKFLDALKNSDEVKKTFGNLDEFHENWYFNEGVFDGAWALPYQVHCKLPPNWGPIKSAANGGLPQDITKVKIEIPGTAADIGLELDKASKKIADEGKAFMDISSGTNMGLIPYIAKMNPKIPCLATDIYAHVMKCWRVYKDRNLADYNIHFASFDNYDIPLRDNSLDCVTSTFGITSSAPEGDSARAHKITIGSEKAISEVYRVLKPGGRLVTVETGMDWDFDLPKIYETKLRGRVEGSYDCAALKAIAEKIKGEQWSKKFTSAGFETEAEEKYQKKVPEAAARHWFFHILSHYLKMRETDDGKMVPLSCLSFDEGGGDCGEAEDGSGVKYNSGDVFFVLRKP